MSLKIERARDLVAKFPNTAKASLAVLLYKENPALYSTVEDARLTIRRATGAQGNKNRKWMKATVKQSQFASGKINNPYDLPEQEHNNFKPYVIPATEKTIIGVISDIHFPYQNNEALTIALNHLKSSKITHLVLLGDVMDC